MNRTVPVLCLGCIAAIGGTTYGMLGASAADRTAVPSGLGGAGALATTPAATALHAARRTCTMPPLDAVVRDLQARAAASPDDRGTWRVLAEALLERVQQRSHLRGLSVGSPVHSELPKDLVEDLESGLAAVTRARELGDDDGDLYRIEASLMSQHITGLGAALQWNPRIQAALAQAIERGRDNPRLQVALGLRKLLAPKLLGHDPGRALEHFEFAARALADDERPAVFAAMASYLQRRRQQAVAWLEQAVARNPNNSFARVVLQRVRRDEPDPFGRDVTLEEVAAAK